MLRLPLAAELFLFLSTLSGGLSEASSADGITNLAGLSSGSTDGKVSRSSLLLVSDSTGLLVADDDFVGEGSSLLGHSSNVLSRGITGLGGTSLEGEEDKLGLVQLKALDLTDEKMERSKRVGRDQKKAKGRKHTLAWRVSADLLARR